MYTVEQRGCESTPGKQLMKKFRTRNAVICTTIRICKQRPPTPLCPQVKASHGGVHCPGGADGRRGHVLQGACGATRSDSRGAVPRGGGDGFVPASGAGELSILEWGWVKCGTWRRMSGIVSGFRRLISWYNLNLELYLRFGVKDVFLYYFLIYIYRKKYVQTASRLLRSTCEKKIGPGGLLL